MNDTSGSHDAWPDRLGLPALLSLFYFWFGGWYVAFIAAMLAGGIGAGLFEPLKSVNPSAVMFNVLEPVTGVFMVVPIIALKLIFDVSNYLQRRRHAPGQRDTESDVQTRTRGFVQTRSDRRQIWRPRR